MRFSLGTCRRWENWGGGERHSCERRHGSSGHEGTGRETQMGRHNEGKGHGAGGRGPRARAAAAAEGSVDRGRVRGQGQGQGQGASVGVGGRESVLQAGGHGDKEGQEAWHSKPNVVLAEWGVVCVRASGGWLGGNVGGRVVLCRGRGRPAATAALRCSLS